MENCTLSFALTMNRHSPDCGLFHTSGCMVTANDRRPGLPVGKVNSSFAGGCRNIWRLGMPLIYNSDALAFPGGDPEYLARLKLLIKLKV